VYRTRIVVQQSVDDKLGAGRVLGGKRGRGAFEVRLRFVADPEHGAQLGCIRVVQMETGVVRGIRRWLKETS
jgi:hypothetical protein